MVDGFSDRHLSVLVIEDNPGDVRLLKEAFSELHASLELHVAQDGAQAIEVLFAEDTPLRPDLVFLDLNLPKVSGHEVLNRLKEDPATKRIPVIILTSSRAEADVRRAYESHANAYIRKPTTLDELITCIRGFKSFWMETARLPKAASHH